MAKCMKQQTIISKSDTVKKADIQNKTDLSLYVHIPFCVKKCDYCDFLSAPADDETKASYVKALIAEIKSYEAFASYYNIKTIFIGGGTPSSIDGKYMIDILSAITEVFKIDLNEIEVTMEINPGTLTKDKLYQYKEAGINRISFGLQSTDDQELKLLGRIHSYQDFLDNYSAARELGFKNINIDLMSALPGQSLNHWLKTLNNVIKLEPEHISAYTLIIEEGTPFYTRYSEEDLDEELDRVIYQKTKEYLGLAGYYPYEISNYAKPGYECRHNITYWTRGDYLGLGLGASSLINNTRFHNEDNLMKYICLSSNHQKIRRNIDELNIKEQMEEFMFLGLRRRIGVNRDDFYRLFHKSLDSVYGEVISKSVLEGLLQENENQVFLTDKGVDLSNTVMSRFLFDKSV